MQTGGAWAWASKGAVRVPPAALPKSSVTPLPDAGYTDGLAANESSTTESPTERDTGADCMKGADDGCAGGSRMVQPRGGSPRSAFPERLARRVEQRVSRGSALRSVSDLPCSPQADLHCSDCSGKCSGCGF